MFFEQEEEFETGVGGGGDPMGLKVIIVKTITRHENNGFTAGNPGSAFP